MIDTNVNSLLEEFFVHLDPTWDVGYLWAMSHGETVKLRLWIQDQKKREVIGYRRNLLMDLLLMSCKKNSQLSHKQVMHTFHSNLTKLISLNKSRTNFMNQPKTHQKPELHISPHPTCSPHHPTPNTHIDMFPAFLSIGLTINPSCEFHATVVQRMWMGFAWNAVFLHEFHRVLGCPRKLVNG